MDRKIPFRALSFSFNDREHGRMLVRMKYLSEEERNGAQPYLLHVEKGPVGRCEAELTEGASVAQASDLCEQLLEAGCFSWEEEYEDNPVNGTSRWMFGLVLEPGVFEVHARGGSDYPVGFDAMLEAFYGLGLPQPKEAGAPSASRPHAGAPGASAGAAGAGSFFNADAMRGMMEQMQQNMGLPDGIDWEGVQSAMRDFQEDPGHMQEALRSEFRAMSEDQRNEVLDLLESMGIASRDWWRRFFLG